MTTQKLSNFPDFFVFGEVMGLNERSAVIILFINVIIVLIGFMIILRHIVDIFYTLRNYIVNINVLPFPSRRKGLLVEMQKPSIENKKLELR